MLVAHALFELFDLAWSWHRGFVCHFHFPFPRPPGRLAAGFSSSGRNRSKAKTTWTVLVREFLLGATASHSPRSGERNTVNGLSVRTGAQGRLFVLSIGYRTRLSACIQFGRSPIGGYLQTATAGDVDPNPRQSNARVFGRDRRPGPGIFRGGLSGRLGRLRGQAIRQLLLGLAGDPTPESRSSRKKAKGSSYEIP